MNIIQLYWIAVLAVGILGTFLIRTMDLTPPEQLAASVAQIALGVALFRRAYLKTIEAIETFETEAKGEAE